MYYTITLNPAIDMLTKVENFELGKLNRTGESKYVVGGKGINISLLLKNIGKKKSTWLYCRIYRVLHQRGIKEATNRFRLC